MDRRQFVMGSTAAAALAGSRGCSNAQSNNTIRIIFPYAAGGTGDVPVRLVADRMQATSQPDGIGRESHRRRWPHWRVGGEEFAAPTD